MSDESRVLLDVLNEHREHSLSVLEDLSDQQLRSYVAPSRWTFLGMILHLASSEHYWIHCMFAGLAPDFHGVHSTELDLWEVGTDESASSIIGLYRHQIDESNELIRASSPDSPLVEHDEAWGTWEVPNLRAVLLQVISHTATHAGHLDLAREMVDGRQWQVL
jgi:hypothetical protein